jgi:hypothetical protein
MRTTLAMRSSASIRISRVFDSDEGEGTKRPDQPFVWTIPGQPPLNDGRTISTTEAGAKGAGRLIFRDVARARQGSNILTGA